MKIKGLTQKQLESIAKKVGVRLYEFCERGKYFQFTLRPNVYYKRLPKAAKDAGLKQLFKWQRKGFSKKRVFGVCYHAHYYFMRLCFEKNPDVIILSKFASYRGKQEFKDNAETAYFKDVGNNVFGDMCYCTLSEVCKAENLDKAQYV